MISSPVSCHTRWMPVSLEQRRTPPPSNPPYNNWILCLLTTSPLVRRYDTNSKVVPFLRVCVQIVDCLVSVNKTVNPIAWSLHWVGNFFLLLCVLYYDLCMCVTRKCCGWLDVNITSLCWLSTCSSLYVDKWIWINHNRDWMLWTWLCNNTVISCARLLTLRSRASAPSLR